MLTVYSRPNCKYCDMAKNHLSTRNVQFNVIDVDENPDAMQMLRDAGHRSLPQIYKNGELFVVGGYEGLKALANEELFDGK